MLNSLQRASATAGIAISRLYVEKENKMLMADSYR